MASRHRGSPYNPYVPPQGTLPPGFTNSRQGNPNPHNPTQPLLVYPPQQHQWNCNKGPANVHHIPHVPHTYGVASYGSIMPPPQQHIGQHFLQRNPYPTQNHILPSGHPNRHFVPHAPQHSLQPHTMPNRHFVPYAIHHPPNFHPQHMIQGNYSTHNSTFNRSNNTKSQICFHGKINKVDKNRILSNKCTKGDAKGITAIDRISKTFKCEPCNREFKTEKSFVLHKKSHISCKHKDCTFSASKKIVQEHYRKAHTNQKPKMSRTMLECIPEKYKNVHKMDETAAEMEKWREARRRNWPSTKNITRKENAAKKAKELGAFVIPSACTSNTSKDNNENPTTETSKSNKKIKKRRNKKRKLCNGTSSIQPKRKTLLQKLLVKEIHSDHNLLLQCINFIVNNNFLCQNTPDTTMVD